MVCGMVVLPGCDVTPNETFHLPLCCMKWSENLDERKKRMDGAAGFVGALFSPGFNVTTNDSFQLLAPGVKPLTVSPALPVSLHLKHLTATKSQICLSFEGGLERACADVLSFLIGRGGKGVTVETGMCLPYCLASDYVAAPCSILWLDVESLRYTHRTFCCAGVHWLFLVLRHVLLPGGGGHPCADALPAPRAAPVNLGSLGQGESPCCPCYLIVVGSRVERLHGLVCSASVD